MCNQNLYIMRVKHMLKVFTDLRLELQNNPTLAVAQVKCTTHIKLNSLFSLMFPYQSTFPSKAIFGFGKFR